MVEGVGEDGHTGLDLLGRGILVGPMASPCGME